MNDLDELPIQPWSQLVERAKLLADTTARGRDPAGLDARIHAYRSVSVADLKRTLPQFPLKAYYALRLRAARGTAFRGEVYD